MGIINPDRPHTLFGVNSLCCCLAPMRVNLTRWCRPSLECMRHPCLYCRMTILPVKSFKKVKVRNLKRIEPKEDDDDGELQDTKDEEGDGTEAPVSKFSGKKKGIVKKGGTNNALSAFGLLGEGDDEDNEDSGITKRILIKKNQDNEVAGFAPNEKQITELKVGKDKRALKVAKRKLGAHKRAKKREEMTFVLQKMRAAGGGEKKK